MPKLDGTGPNGQGAEKGRKLGQCNESDANKEEKIGKGMGKRRKEGGGAGKGKRLQSGK